MPLIKPARENRMAVNRIMLSMTQRLWMLRGVNIRDTSVTATPTVSPRATPPEMKPVRMT